MRSTRKAALVAAVLAAALAGCGGGDGDAGLSKEEFIAKAEPICADANRKEQGIVKEGPGWLHGPKFSNPELMTPFTRVGRDALRRLRALEPPEEDRQTLDEVFTHIETGLDAIEQEIAAVRARKRGTTAGNLQEYETAYGDLASAAGRYGFTECQGVGF